MTQDIRSVVFKSRYQVEWKGMWVGIELDAISVCLHCTNWAQQWDNPTIHNAQSYCQLFPVLIGWSCPPSFSSILAQHLTKLSFQFPLQSLPRFLVWSCIGETAQFGLCAATCCVYFTIIISMLLIFIGGCPPISIFIDTASFARLIHSLAVSCL